MSSNDDILHLYYIRLYVQVYYLSINELKLLTNLEKIFHVFSSTTPCCCPLIFCKFEYDNYKFMQCILFRCLKCTKFGQLILRKIIKKIATSCQILRLIKCTTFDFGWGSAQTPLGELTALPQTP